MAELRNNTWTLNAWYDQDVAGTAGYTAGGEMWGAGYNAYGQLGQNNLTNYSSPVQVPGTNWSSVRGGHQSMLMSATKLDGTLWTMGDNTQGALGLNNITHRSSPVQVPGTEWSQEYRKGSVLYYGYGMTAIRTDGTLWTWGRNTYGELCQNTSGNNQSRSSPVQIPGSWSQVGQGAGLKTDGSLWAWGPNYGGKLGQNQGYPALNYASSAVQIPGTWAGFYVGGTSAGNSDETMGGVKTDGTLWSWGYNSWGQLGHNDLVNKSAPIQITGGGANWSSIMPVTGDSKGQMFAKTDGTLWRTGGGSAVGSDAKRSSPVQMFASFDTDVSGMGWVTSASGGWLVNKTGNLLTWGPSSFGWKGNNTTSPTNVPDSTTVAAHWDISPGTIQGKHACGSAHTFYLVKPI